jgi:hypothetical protein
MAQVTGPFASFVTLTLPHRRHRLSFHPTILCRFALLVTSVIWKAYGNQDLGPSWQERI